MREQIRLTALALLLAATPGGCAAATGSARGDPEPPARLAPDDVLDAEEAAPPLPWPDEEADDAEAEGAGETTGRVEPAGVSGDEPLRLRYADARPLGTLQGKATHYSDALAGRLMANGVPYDPAGYTAAHRTLPFGTVLRVRRPGAHDDVYVRVTDRGPFGRRGIIVDLSRAAAERIGLVRAGVADVLVEILHHGKPRGRGGRSR